MFMSREQLSTASVSLPGVWQRGGGCEAAAQTPSHPRPLSYRPGARVLQQGKEPTASKGWFQNSVQDFCTTLISQKPGFTVGTPQCCRSEATETSFKSLLKKLLLMLVRCFNSYIFIFIIIIINFDLIVILVFYSFWFCEILIASLAPEMFSSLELFVTLFV